MNDKIYFIVLGIIILYLIFNFKNVETFEENTRNCEDCVCYPNNVCICKHCHDSNNKENFTYEYLQKRYCNPSGEKWTEDGYTRHKVEVSATQSKEEGCKKICTDLGDECKVMAVGDGNENGVDYNCTTYKDCNISAVGTSSSWTNKSGTTGGNYEYYEKKKVDNVIEKFNVCKLQDNKACHAPFVKSEKMPLSECNAWCSKNHSGNQGCEYVKSSGICGLTQACTDFKEANTHHGSQCNEPLPKMTMDQLKQLVNKQN